MASIKHNVRTERKDISKVQETEELEVGKTVVVGEEDVTQQIVVGLGRQN